MTSSTHAIPLRIAIGAVLLLALAGLSAVLATQRADAGAVGTLVVNSTSNTDDGKCHGPPNDLAVGNCTFREAINDVNAGLANEIKFHQAVFSSSTPGIIELELGLGPLPPILREVTIDAKQRGVVLDGDFDNDGIGVPWGVLVVPTHNGFDFTLNGGGETFIIRDVGCELTNTGGGDDSVAGPGICLNTPGTGDNGISTIPVTGPGVGLLIDGFCQFAEPAGAEVSGRFINPCCPPGGGGGGIAGLCATGSGNDSVSGPPILIGGPFSLGDIIIDGIEVHNAMGSTGVAATGTNINNFNLTNSWIEADLDGVVVTAFSTPSPTGHLSNNNVHINGNLISGGLQGAAFGEGQDGVSGVALAHLVAGQGSGVFVDICCDLGSKVTVDVSDNDAITGNVGDGVWLNYCFFAPDCESEDGSQFNYSVNNNGKIAGFGDGIHIDIISDGNSTSPLDGEGHNLDADIQIDGNAIVDGENGDGVQAEVVICCRNSDNTASFAVTNNDDIVGDNDGVEIDAAVGEGPDNTVNVNVDDNHEITGEGDEGVDIDVIAGTSTGDPAIDADENTVNVSVSRNDDIAGDDDDGVEIDAYAGKAGGAGDADRNVTHVKVDDNGDIDGEDDGIDVDARSGTADGPGDADDNLTTVSVSGNGTVDGSDATGIDLDIVAGHTEEAPIVNVTGDGNSTEIVVDGNGVVKGHDGDGVDADSRAGALEPTGEENHTSVRVINNAELHGFQGGGDGVEVESKVCCDPDNENGGQTNFIEISGNGDIIGNDADGIDINEVCCSINTILIQSNTGVIKGNNDSGIEIGVCLQNGDPTDADTLDFGTEPQDDIPCMGDSVTMLMITENNISNSGNDGIIICCGAFQFPLNQAPPAVAGEGALKSLIKDNVISHNGEDGIDLDTTIGINVVENEIFQNGTSALDGDNGVEIDWQFGYFIASALCLNGGGQDGVAGANPFCVKIPAHFNRISQNSIYDNAGLGINLIGTSLDPFFPVPGSGTEEPGWPLADGVGCIQLDFTPVAANDCIPYPKILFTGGPTVAKVSGQACANCHVEVFIADPTPTDQTGPLGRQFGEGRTYLVTTTSDDLGDFSVNLSCGLAGGELTATATDKLKNTSEFASNIPFPGTPACAAATEQPTEPPSATDTPVPPAPTATAAPPTATAEPAGVCGDVNSDGVTNAVDASLILQMGAGIIADLPKGNAAGDVNADGSTNAVDATLILQQAASMIAGLSC